MGDLSVHGVVRGAHAHIRQRSSWAGPPSHAVVETSGLDFFSYAVRLAAAVQENRSLVSVAS